MNVTAGPKKLPVTASDVRAAAARFGDAVLHTPTARSQTLSSLTGADVWVKFEQHQFTASFKERGALNRLLQLDEHEQQRGVLAVSAGNHAQGVAHHARRLGIPATIVMPATTPTIKVSRTRVLGAEVVLHGHDFERAAAHAAELAASRGLVTVHPFDDAFVIAGQGTVGLELLADVPQVDVVLVPVGGGGLIGGIAVALKTFAPHVQVIGVQVAGHDWAARRKGHAPTEANGPTVAEGIAVKYAGVMTGQIIDALVDDVLVVSDDAVEEAVAMYLEYEKVVAEGAGAAPLACLLEHRDRFAGLTCGLVLSGGNIDLRLLAGISLRCLARSGRTARISVVVDDRPGVLATVVRAISDTGGNIVELDHVRHRSDVPSRRAKLEVEIEMAGATEIERVLLALRSGGFEPTLRT